MTGPGVQDPGYDYGFSRIILIFLLILFLIDFKW